MTDRRKQANEAELAAEEWWVNYPGVSEINPGTGAEYRAWRKSHQQAFLAGVYWAEEGRDKPSFRYDEAKALADCAEAIVSELTAKLEEAERRVGEMYDLLGAAENLIYTYRLGPGSDKVEALLNKWRNEWRRYALLASSESAEGEKSPLCNIGEGEK